MTPLGSSTTKDIHPAHGTRFKRVIGSLLGTLLCAVTACSTEAQATEWFTDKKMAFVEYYDEAELEEVELGAVLYPGSGHDQATSVWRIRLDLGMIDPDLDWIPFGADGRASRLESTGTTGLRFEHMLSRYIGVELGVLSIRKITVPADAGGFGGAKLGKFSPFSLGLNLHLTPNRPLDLYVGAQIANIGRSNLHITTRDGSTSSTTPISSGVGWGVSAGADIPIGRQGWLVHAGMRYLHFPFDYEITPARQESFSGYVIHAGVGYRF